MIYFVRDDTRIKIGFSDSPRQRIMSLREQGILSAKSKLLGVVAGDAQKEISIHAHFKKWHITREWFSLGCMDEAMRVIASNGAAVIDSTANPFIRDSTGRFAVGSHGGSGNKHARKHARIKAIIAESVSDEDARAIFRVLVTKATAGNLEAARTVAHFIKHISPLPLPEIPK